MPFETQDKPALRIAAVIIAEKKRRFLATLGM